MSKNIVKLHLRSGEEFTISAEDESRVRTRKWCFQNRRGRRVIVSYEGRRREIKKTYYLNRFILNAPPGVKVLFRDGDERNFTRENLYMPIVERNLRDQTAPTNSAFLGVSWHRARAKWQMQIVHKGKHMHIGLYLSELEAGKEYERIMAMTPRARTFFLKRLRDRRAARAAFSSNR